MVPARLPRLGRDPTSGRSPQSPWTQDDPAPRDQTQANHEQRAPDLVPVVYDVSMDLSTRHAISDELFARAKATLGEQPLVDLVAISGTYVTVAMLLGLGEENSPADKPVPFPETVK